MGKKSKRNRVKKGKSTAEPPPHPENSLESAETEDLPEVTIDQVRKLPAATSHVWKVVVFEDDSVDFLTLGVMDMTNQIVDGADMARAMMFRKCELNDATKATQIILNAMIQPSSGPTTGRHAAFHKPRRPRFLLIDPRLEPSYGFIKSQVELTGVPVRLYTENSFAEAAAAATEPAVHPRSTYLDGFIQGPTAAIVAEMLPQTDEIWMVSNYNIGGQLDQEGYVLLVIENITTETDVTMVGSGPIRACNSQEALLATMLSPVVAAKGGVGPVRDGMPRRPSLVLLEAGSGEGLELLRDALLGSGVEVKIHNADVDFCASCHKESRNLLDCECREISYCSQECQRSHWSVHRENCERHQQKKEEAEE